MVEESLVQRERGKERDAEILRERHTENSNEKGREGRDRVRERDTHRG